MTDSTCATCEGRGFFRDDEGNARWSCHKCNGTGRTPTEQPGPVVLTKEMASDLADRLNEKRFPPSRADTGGVRIWPFVESPGEFADRLTEALRLFDGYVLGAVRNVLIENPPQLASDYDAKARECEELQWRAEHWYRVAGNIEDKLKAAEARLEKARELLDSWSRNDEHWTSDLRDSYQREVLAFLREGRSTT